MAAWVAIFLVDMWLWRDGGRDPTTSDCCGPAPPP